MLPKMLTCLAMFVVALVFAPASASAQSTGCPWCVSPTTCGEVQENGEIGGCFNVGSGCQTIPGSCQISESFATIGREHLLRNNRIEFRGTLVAELWGTTVELTGINNGLYAEWACDGQLAAVFKQDEKGKLVELNPALYGQRFALSTKSGPSIVGSVGFFSTWTTAGI